jgi:hypothetical protein
VLTALAGVLGLAGLPKAHAAGGPERQLSGADTYVQVSGLHAPVTQSFSVVGVMTIEAGLDVQDTATRDRINGTLPRVRDALRSEVAQYTSGFYRFGTVPDADLIQRRMQRAIDRQLGPEKATVLLNAVIVHRSR